MDNGVQVESKLAVPNISTGVYIFIRKTLLCIQNYKTVGQAMGIRQISPCILYSVISTWWINKNNLTVLLFLKKFILM